MVKSPFDTSCLDSRNVIELDRLQKSENQSNVIPAEAGIQKFSGATKNWIPAFTGMTTFARHSELFLKIFTPGDNLEGVL